MKEKTYVVKHPTLSQKENLGNVWNLKDILEEKLLKYIHVLLVVSMGHLNFGTCLGWASPMMYHFLQHESQFNEKGFSSFATWMTSMVPLGASVGVGVWTVMGYKKGPRKTLLILSVIYFILLVCLFFSSYMRSLLQASRFFLGFFGVGYMVCGDMLMNDTTHRTLLKYSRIAPRIALLVGVILVQLSGIFSEYTNTAWGCMTTTFLTFIMLYIMPESPVHMYQKGETFAEKSLSWYIGKDNISDTMRRIRRDYEYRRMNIEDKYMLNSNVVRKGVLIVIGIIVFQVGTGYHLFQFYSTIIWSKVPLIDVEWDITVLGIVLIFSRLFWALAHLKLNWPVRKPLMISCTIVATAQLVLATILLFLNIEVCISTNYLRWCCFVCCFFIVFGYELGLNHYTAILLYMYIPFQVYQTVTTIVNSVFWFLVFFIIKFHGFWHTGLPSWLLFLVISIFLYTGTLYMYLFVVEVKHKSLVQIQLDIGGNPTGTRAASGMRLGPSDI
ncbi:hypothetical protein WA026_012158 [Henosepilachna vigintioctopunctata]|uniref:Uncharacterized protein n=1 Tax=Henosepilachna vigintioctopunctata TaxID=420089 RepID=A0AAW1V7Z5_9CUCU